MTKGITTAGRELRKVAEDHYRRIPGVLYRHAAKNDGEWDIGVAERENAAFEAALRQAGAGIPEDTLGAVVKTAVEYVTDAAIYGSDVDSGHLWAAFPFVAEEADTLRAWDWIKWRVAFARILAKDLERQVHSAEPRLDWTHEADISRDLMRMLIKSRDSFDFGRPFRSALVKATEPGREKARGRRIWRARIERAVQGGDI